jgi:N-carbamoyl-L-amino-acid hydrolase
MVTPAGHTLTIDQDRLWSDLTGLAAITEPDRPWTRRSFSPRFLEGRAFLTRRFQEAGLAVRLDAAGNLIGRLAGQDPQAPVIMIGSHSDTVPSGGRFDGVAGVLAGLEIIRAAADAGIRFNHTIEIVDFLAEEPSDYGLSCVGSRGMAGVLSEDLLGLGGPGGETLAAAIDRIGGDVSRLHEAKRDDVAAFLELHIEQGPVLECTGTDVGIVTAIAGVTRLEIVFKGATGHAGTVPMPGRRDASVAAAKAILAVRDTAATMAAGDNGYFAGTTGVVDILPGGANVIPGESRIIADLRCERRDTVTAFLATIKPQLERIADSEGCELATRLLSDNPPADCDTDLRRLLEAMSEAMGISSLSLTSGAGHDAAFVSRIAPAAMVFVPCRGGLSHCPEEWSEPGQIATGTDLLFKVVQNFDARNSRGILRDKQIDGVRPDDATAPRHTG